MRHVGICFVAAFTLFVITNVPAAAQVRKNEEEKKALVKRAESFVAAFNKGDAKALAGFWVPDGTYTDRTGHQMKGRGAIQKEFENFFARNKGLKLLITIDSLRFVTKNVAVEEGTTEVLHPDGAPPSQARYVIVHVKRDGQWYLDSVKDSIYTPPTNYKHLKVLDWVIGEWEDDVTKGEVGRMSFSWGLNQNFIVGSFATTFKSITLTSGTQWIGWDPSAKKVRSWTFDSHGGFGEGSWSNKGNKWFIKTKTVLRDGKTVTATNIITRIDTDTISWQSVDRAVNGKALDDTQVIRMKRIK